MADQCTAGDDAPPPEPPPPPIHTSYDLWHPGGDPGALRDAARAWRSLAEVLRHTAGDIDAGARELARSWHGEAARQFARYWSGLHGGLVDGAAHADEVAGTLDRVADEIERINHEIHELYVAIAATVAVSLVASVFTFGASTAAGAAVTAANVARATTLVEGLAEFLSVMRVGFEVSRLYRFWRLWSLAVTANTVAVGVVKAGQGQNPVDPGNWSWRDATGIVVNADFGVAATGLLGPGVAAGATGAAGGSVATDVALDGRDPFSTRVLLDATVAGVTGGAATAVGQRGLDALRSARQAHLGAPIAPELALIRGSGSARSADDLFLPGRPAPEVTAPAPTPSGPVLYLPGELHPRPLLPSRPVPQSTVDLVDGGVNVVGSATGTIGTWPLYGTGGPTVAPPCMPRVPVLAGH
jgi:uncharacterized protein YukE